MNNNKKLKNNSKKRQRDYKDKNERRFDDQIEGRNSVLELLESGKDINKIFVSRGEKQGSINKIIGKAKDNKVVIVEIDKNKLDEMSETRKSSRSNSYCTSF